MLRIQADALLCAKKTSGVADAKVAGQETGPCFRSLFHLCWTTRLEKDNVRVADTNIRELIEFYQSVERRCASKKAKHMHGTHVGVNYSHN